jgi:nitrate reductase alpha subunit
MIAFGEGFSSYRPPVDLKTTDVVQGVKPNGHKEIVLNFITPHQKWGIHSTYSDNLHMLTLNRGGTVIWLSEDDAKSAGIEDNDWIELFNVNGAVAGRAVVSQRVKNGMVMMYHSQEKIIGNHRRARRYPQLGDPHRAQAHPHDRWLCTAELWLQLLRNYRHQP